MFFEKKKKNDNSFQFPSGSSSNAQGPMLTRNEIMSAG